MSDGNSQHTQIRGKIIDQIAAQFSNAANTYEHAAVVEREVGQRLISRLNDLKINPRIILDLGCGTGYFTPYLQEIFPNAQIINLDFAIGMLKIASQKSQSPAICSSATQLPLLSRSVDLIFANCCFPHVPEITAALTETQRVLSNNGVMLFTSYGYRTLEELGMAGHWPDMHDLGDLLLKLNFKDPVVDTELLHFKYNHVRDLIADLQETGAYQIDPLNITHQDQPITATYEIIYGHAWGKPITDLENNGKNIFYVKVTR